MTAPDPATVRRDALLVLLSRAERGVLARPEAVALRGHVETELAEADRLAAAAAAVGELCENLPPVVPGTRDYALGHCAGWNDALDTVSTALGRALAALPAHDIQETTRA